MPPPAWFFTAVVLMIGLAVFAPGPSVVGETWSLAGLVPIALGVALNVAAVVAFRRHATTTDPDGQPSALVTDGIYAVLRNPMYAGGVLILLGFALLLDAPTTLAIPPLYWLLARSRFIPPEERKLERAFGDGWRAYARRTVRGL